jgi:elongation factor P
MATLNSNELKEGKVFKDDGNTYLVLKYSHIKKGRGQAVIKVKVRDLESGSITEKSYTNEQKVDEAMADKRSCQFLYADGKALNFMDTRDYSQFKLGIEETGDAVNYLTEGQKVVTLFLEDRPVSIELPKNVELEVTDTTAATAGNTATNATKAATLETGYEIQVPLFIEEGEKIKVNTETGEYVARA